MEPESVASRYEVETYIEWLEEEQVDIRNEVARCIVQLQGLGGVAGALAGRIMMMWGTDASAEV